MLYYLNYNPAEDKRYVLAYDEEKHGKAQVVDDHTVFLYHRSIKAWGEYSVKPVIMPDGTEKQQMTSNHFRGLDCIAQNRYAQEIKRSYFYIV